MIVELKTSMVADEELVAIKTRSSAEVTPFLKCGFSSRQLPAQEH
ncbi:hypothetical protein X975_17734, partial [Stegodyphus mimosarum]